MNTICIGNKTVLRINVRLQRRDDVTKNYRTKKGTG